jgi:uncharacterized membrane protein (DUF485 family)
MSRKQSNASAYTGLALLVFYVAIIIAVGWGWILNILQVVHSTVFSGLLLARVLGLIFPPLGAILGWFA